MMAKAQFAARFATEVAPPPLVSIVRQKSRIPKILDTIAEDEKEAAAAEEHFSSPFANNSRSESASSFMRELDRSFSIHGQEWPLPLRHPRPPHDA